MRNEILDDFTTKTRPRQCPECGWQFPYPLFVKAYILKFGFSKWTCPSCKKFIKYNYFKSNLIGAVAFFVILFAFMGLRSFFEWEVHDIYFLIPFYFFVLVQLNFERLERYE